MSGFGSGFETRSWSFMKLRARWIAPSVARCYSTSYLSFRAPSRNL